MLFDICCAPSPYTMLHGNLCSARNVNSASESAVIPSVTQAVSEETGTATAHRADPQKWGGLEAVVGASEASEVSRLGWEEDGRTRGCCYSGDLSLGWVLLGACPHSQLFCSSL